MMKVLIVMVNTLKLINLKLMVQVSSRDYMKMYTRKLSSSNKLKN